MGARHDPPDPPPTPRERNLRRSVLEPELLVTIGRFPDGIIGEVFIDGGKSGQDVQSTARDAAVAISLALQHGVPIETIRHAVTRCSDGSTSSILGAAVDRISDSFSGGTR